MTTRPTLRIPAIGAILASLALAPPALSQQLHKHEAIPETQLQEANRLFAQATALMGTFDRADWMEAADLFLQSASLRPCQDPKVLEGQDEAAYLYYYLGEFEKAHRAFRLAAVHALSIGDLVNAAEEYVNAAWVAARLGLAAETDSYLAMADDITASQLLGDETERLKNLVAARGLRPSGN